MTENNPFVYTNAILDGRNPIEWTEESEKEYIPFLTNRALSQHPDCLAIANKINEMHSLPKEMQFDYLKAIVPKKKRAFKKWPKRQPMTDEIKAIMEYYQCNEKRAREYNLVLTKEQTGFIMGSLEKGG